jgi:hypothetical protein
MHPSPTRSPEILPRGKSCSRETAEADPFPSWGKADATEEETGKGTLWNRRGMGSSIQGKIHRDNVGKNPLAAGAGSNLQRLLERG